MHNSRLFLLVVCFILNLFWSCTSDKKVDNEAVRKEIDSREIKKVTEAEIVTEVIEIGNSIALQTKKTLGKNLQTALQSGGIEHAIGYCNLNAMPLVDSLSRSYDAKIRRVTIKARNPNDFPNEIERALLEAYTYDWKDSLQLQTNVQEIEGNNYLFTKPILIDNELCLKCHGTLDNGLSQETDELIKSKYPVDKATGYNLGELRGMWSITISKKKVVLSM